MGYNDHDDITVKPTNAHKTRLVPLDDAVLWEITLKKNCIHKRRVDVDELLINLSVR